MMPTDAVLRDYRDGDELGWYTEFENLHRYHKARLDEIAMSACTEGIRVPILLGNDGRVWDGHHRLCVADGMGIEYVPVQFA